MLDTVFLTMLISADRCLKRYGTPLTSAVLSFALFFLSPAPGFADADDQQRLSALEQQLFFVQYAQETVDKRLERLEKSVFGQLKAGTVPTRLGAIERVITRYQAPSPSSSSSPAPSDGGMNTPIVPMNVPINGAFKDNEPKRPDATDYPTVVSLERTVFSRDFVHDSLDRRLERLENKVYGRSFPQLPMADRVDNLLMRYPQANLGRPVTPRASEVVVTPSQTSSYGQSPFTSDVYAKLNALEIKILGMNARQEGKLLTERLETLEQRVFGYGQSGGIQDRVDHLAKAVQTNPRPMASGVNPNPAARNVQVGVGVSSQSQYQYSPELLNLLPNDIRQRVQQGSTVSTGSGTVTMTETTTTPSGFYTLPNGVQVYQPPMQYQQSYQMTPTVISPPRSGPIGQTPSFIPDTLPPQSSSIRAPQPTYPKLDTLEMKVFNHVNQGDDPEMRLWKIESYLTNGKSFSGYSIDERIENAWKIYQYHYLGNILQSPASPPAQTPQ